MMTIQDLIAEIVLAAFDRFMNSLTHGSWTHIRGSEIPNIKIKEM
jgi:hypothetical protein